MDDLGNEPVASRNKILIMDDENLVRETTTMMLKRLGYKVDCAKDGDEAIEMYALARKADQPFKAVILDLNIPGGMGGQKAIKELRAIDPEVKAIVASGDVTNPVMADFKKYGFIALIQKPFDILELSNILQKVKLA